jgi:hypothetical protein
MTGRLPDQSGNQPIENMPVQLDMPQAAIGTLLTDSDTQWLIDLPTKR